MAEPFVSIVISAHNSADILPECLESIKKLDYPRERFEVIVVDDGSEDNTAQVAESMGAKVLRTEHRGPASARNLGAETALGEFVAFTDADCQVHPQWLRELLRPFDHSVAALGGCQELANPSFVRRSIHSFLSAMGFWGGYTKSSRSICQTDHNPACNSIYRRSIFLEAGGFNPKLFPGEDVELDHRLSKKSFRILYNPSAIVYHRRGGLKSFAAMMFRYGRSAGCLLSRYRILRPLYFMPFLLLAVACLTILLCLAYKTALPLVVALASPLIFFLVADPPGAPVLWLLFLLTLVCWNAGYLIGFISGRSRVV